MKPRPRYVFRSGRGLSPNNHHNSLQRWAARRGVDIGKESYNGYAVFVDPAKPVPGQHGALAVVVVEGRGTVGHRLRLEYPFFHIGVGAGSRNESVRLAVDLLNRLRAP